MQQFPPQGSLTDQQYLYLLNYLAFLSVNNSNTNNSNNDNNKVHIENAVLHAIEKARKNNEKEKNEKKDIEEPENKFSFYKKNNNKTTITENKINENIEKTETLKLEFPSLPIKKIGNDEITYFLEALDSKKCKNEKLLITSLDLSDLKINLNTFSSITKIIKDYATPETTINLSYNKIGDKELMNLAKEEEWEDIKIKELNLSNNNISPDGAKYIVDIIKNNSVAILKLYDNKIGDDWLMNFAQAFKNTKGVTIKELNLSNNNIGPDGIKHITKIMKNNSIEKLFLSNNKIGDNGIKRIANTIVAGVSENDQEKNKKPIEIKFLYLGNNTISSNGAGYLAEKLEKKDKNSPIRIYFKEIHLENDNSQEDDNNIDQNTINHLAKITIPIYVSKQTTSFFTLNGPAWDLTTKNTIEKSNPEHNNDDKSKNSNIQNKSKFLK